MKRFRIFSLLLFIMAAVGFSSCDVENLAEDSAPRLKTNKSIVNVIQTGKLKNGSTPTVEVVANKGYEISSDQSWLNVDKPQGTGRVILQILAEPNETGAPREGTLKITSLDRSMTVTVKQSLEEDTDDRMPIGHVYYADDFSWCIGGSDDVGAKKNLGEARNIYTYDFVSNGFPNCKELFKQRYEDLNPNKETVYASAGYIKFDRTNAITAIAIKDLGIAEGKTTSVRVTFKAARYSDDDTNIVLAIEGTGSIPDANIANNRTITNPFLTKANNEVWTWYEISYDIISIDSNTKIIFGDQAFVRDNITSTGTFRWYLDDIKVEKIEG